MTGVAGAVTGVTATGAAAGVVTDACAAGTGVGRGIVRAVSGNMFMNPAGEGAPLASGCDSGVERDA